MKASIRNRSTGAFVVGPALRSWGVAGIVGLVTLLPVDLAAQGRGNSRVRSGSVVVANGPGSNSAEARSRSPVVFSVDLQSIVREFYSSRPSSRIATLPPGIRRNLARGKPLPPGIAKRYAPSNLSQRVRVPQGYRLVEVGRDLLLVNIATNLIHDILLDVVR